MQTELMLRRVGISNSSYTQCLNGLITDDVFGPKQALEFERLKSLWCVFTLAKIGAQKSRITFDASKPTGITRSEPDTVVLNLERWILRETSKPRYANALGFILAHELGHIQLDHKAKRSDAQFKNMAALALTAVTATVAFGAKTGSRKVLLGTIAATLGVVALDQYCKRFDAHMSHELESDNYALNLLKDLSMSPAESAEAFVSLTRDIRIPDNEQSCLEYLKNVDHLGKFDPHPSLIVREQNIQDWLNEKGQ